MKEVFAVFGIFLIGVFTLVITTSYTGQVAYSQYGVQKVYGGAWKKAETRPSMVGEAYASQLYVEKLQEYIYDHKSDWDCSFGDEAENSIYPCIFDENIGKYCCVVSEDSGNLNQFGRLS